MTTIDPCMPDDAVLDLCCGKKTCPILRDEGDAIVVADPHVDAAPVRIAKADLPAVIAWLERRAVR